MKIALATCLEKPEGTFDDQLLKAALVKAGHTADFRVWNAAADWTAYDTCLIRSTWDYHRHLPKFLSWIHTISKHLRVMNPLDVVKWNSDKKYLCELGNNGVSVVPTKVFTSAEEAVKAIAKHVEDRRAVIKPTVSATADLTFKVDSGKDLDSLVKSILARSALVLQPYVESIEEEGELSLIYFKVAGKAKFTHAIAKRPKRGEFRVQEDFGGSVEKVTPPDHCLAVAQRALDAIPHKWHYARVDLVDWKAKAQVGELELIEPELFFRLDRDSLDSMVQCLA
ncbi:MAG: hypothetical protein AAB250_10875 [Bdellovibrionota bacterium]|mgnify:FL=1